MKLLTPDAGWAATKRVPLMVPSRLYWTTSAGAQWKEVTPPHRRDEDIADVFFLDTQTGWVLFSRYDEPEPQFELASTADAGATWSVTPVTVPDLNPDSTTLAGGGHIVFADVAHGWMNLGIVSGAAFNFGALLITSDGGKTWSDPPRGSPAVFGPIALVTPQDGWLVDGAGYALYATHDGGNSWQQLDVKAPKQIYPAIYATYSLPIFEDAQHGFLPVTYSGDEDAKSAAVLFSTKDGGRTWSPESILPNLEGTSRGQSVVSTVIDSTWIAAPISDHHHLVFSRFGANPRSSEAGADLDLDRSGVEQLSFATPAQGWMLRPELLSTADGGATWTKITPGPRGLTVVNKGVVGVVPPAVPPTIANPEPQTAVPEGGKPKTPDSTPAAPSPPQANISTHLGFDRKFVARKDQMQTWWNRSPYFDVAFYLNGGASHPTDPLLNPAWVGTVSSYGWGLMPLWAGPQSPCTCYGGGTYPNCTLYQNTFSDDPAAAQVQGGDEAVNATNSANALGLAGTYIIYYDMERYESSDCGPAVSAFLTGWVQGIHAEGTPGNPLLAGVYGNGPDANDWLNASPHPDDVWIALYNSTVTVWGLSWQNGKASLDDSLWANGQRIHQYHASTGKAPYTETWGNVNLEIDNDIEDAPVLGGNDVNNYTFTTSTFDYPGATYTVAAGINNGGPGGELGKIVGYYIDTADNSHAFVVSGSTFASFDCVSSPGQTGASSINNEGEVVGTYFGSDHVDRGQLFSYGRSKLSG